MIAPVSAYMMHKDASPPRLPSINQTEWQAAPRYMSVAHPIPSLREVLWPSSKNNMLLISPSRPMIPSTDITSATLIQPFRLADIVQ